MPTSCSNRGEPEPRTIDAPKRLSRSVIWDHQRRYFESAGVTAWTSGAVPHHITCNPFLADAYARLVLAALRDWARTQGRLDVQQTVYLVELGAGPGRFAAYFLRAFSSQLQRSELRQLRFKYVITDLVEANVDFCQSHAGLADYIEKGMVDFATYDATASHKEIQLRLENRTLEADEVCNPMVVLANYFFDAIAQDVFYIDGKVLHEALVGVYVEQPTAPRTDADFLRDARLVYEHVVASEAPYDDADFNRILHDYQQRLGSATVLFPVMALENLKYFRQLSGERLVLICADKGHHWEEDLIIGWGEPPMALHGGCFSMSLNFHALGRYVENAGGTLLQSSHRYNNLDVATFVLGLPPDALCELPRNFGDSIERFSPADLFSVLQGAEAAFDTMSTDQLLALLRLSRWDGCLLIRLLPPLVQQVPHCNPWLREELNWIVRHVAESFYDIDDGTNLPFGLGTLHCALGNHREALHFLQESLKRHSGDPRALHNMALCHEALNELDAARQGAQAALAADAAFDPARQMIVRLDSRIGRESMRG